MTQIAYTTKKDGMHDLYILILSIVAVVGILAIVLFVVIIRAANSGGNAFGNLGQSYKGEVSTVTMPFQGYVSGEKYFIGKTDVAIVNRDGSIHVINNKASMTISCECKGTDCKNTCLITTNMNYYSCSSSSCQMNVVEN
jgi:hypothetical protein